MESTVIGLDMKLSGSYQLEHHGSNMSSLDDDRWVNTGYDAPVIGCDIWWMWFLVFPLLCFKLVKVITKVFFKDYNIIPEYSILGDCFGLKKTFL